MANLPYNPTAVLASEAFDGYLYILQSDEGSTDVELKLANISSSLSSSNLETINVSSSPPFSTSDGASFTAFASSKGEVYVVTGQCDKKLSGASVWVFEPNGDGKSGTWTQSTLNLQAGSNGGGLLGSSYLAGGASFSSNPNGTQDLYYFGGMCPSSSDESVSQWQSSADYSGTLLYMQPSSDDESSMYTVETIAERGPPIPEAGFTITPLSPTYFNSSTGNVSMQQNFVMVGGHTETAFINMSQVAILSLPEQSWSFIPVDNPASNMVEPRSGHSAVLSEDGESVVIFGGWVGDVNTPADPQLAVIQIGDGYGGSGDWQWTVPASSGTSPTSGGNGMYGHGAAMLPGNVLMVTGGRQIAAGSGELVRRAGAASQDTFLYNLTSNSWITSYTNPNSSSKSAGDGASGGTSESTKIGLGAGLGIGLALLIALILAVLLYRRKKKNKREVRDEDLRGLSIGGPNPGHSEILGFGGVDNHRDDRAPMSENYAEYPFTQGPDAYPWAPSLNEGVAPVRQLRRNNSDQAERTGVLVEVPSPTRGLRRSLHSRGSSGQYWPHEDGRRSRGSSRIHPIDERDEYEAVSKQEPEAVERKEPGSEELDIAQIMASGEMAQIRPAPLFAGRRPSDPFADPTEQRSLLDGSRSPSPTSPFKDRDMEILGTLPEGEAMDNMAIAGAAGGLAVIGHERHQQGDAEHGSLSTGRVSPNSKSDRTLSSLSEQSARSMVSALSQQPPPPSRGSISRAASQISTAIFSSRPLSSAGMTSYPSTDLGSAILSPSENYRIKRRPVSMQHPRPALAPGVPVRAQIGPDASASSPYNSAGRPVTPTFSQLQAEGPALLYGTGNSPQSMSMPRGTHQPQTQDDENDFDAEPLPTHKSGPRPRSWMGSVRRALGGAAAGAGLGRNSPSPPGRSSTSSSPRRENMPRFPLTGGSDHPSYVAVDGAESSGAGLDPFMDPMPSHPERRATSASGELWSARRHHRHGSRDWAGELVAIGGSSSSDAASRGTASVSGRGDDDDLDWDVESAVERRVVQLMFTVPREKLRVVNAAPDAEADVASLRSGPSVRSVASTASRRSRKNKGRGVGGERSVGSLRRVFEGEAPAEEVSQMDEMEEDKGKGKEKAVE